ncbi:hypothetical protein OKW30_005481 [Paraburkholderia sp. Clong3]
MKLASMVTHLLSNQPRDVAPVQVVHRGKSRTLSAPQRRWLKRRQAIEPIIGHVKQDHGMRRCWLKGQTGDALHAVLCAVGYNLRWLLRAIARLGIKPAFFVLMVLRLFVDFTSITLLSRSARGFLQLAK